MVCWFVSCVLVRLLFVVLRFSRVEIAPGAVAGFGFVWVSRWVLSGFCFDVGPRGGRPLRKFSSGFSLGFGLSLEEFLFGFLAGFCLKFNTISIQK